MTNAGETCSYKVASSENIYLKTGKTEANINNALQWFTVPVISASPVLLTIRKVSSAFQ